MDFPLATKSMCNSLKSGERDRDRESRGQVDPRSHGWAKPDSQEQVVVNYLGRADLFDSTPNVVEPTLCHSSAGTSHVSTIIFV